ncbi:DUF4190 domain-containing protein [Actinomadura rudentiformis]|uniref:DUF4190 domain-containing protein n=1 Tax=Actinomadura rudentiformis TaxID=359158 RepID=A0A6H9YTW6_9ACTN|nr:DUF4190 domain-containing protein [Actinomadura rudentiformis]KAB2343987.1 DUF4190 domain-containing protein [Actinomadura rudentiformis]
MSQPPHDRAPGEQPDDKPDTGQPAYSEPPPHGEQLPYKRRPQPDEPPSLEKPGDRGEQAPQPPAYGQTAPQELPPFPEPPPSYQEQRDYGQPPSYAQHPPTGMPPYPQGGFPPGQAAASGRTNALAIGSLVAGIVGIVCGVGSIVAIVLGHLALSKIKKTGEAGRGLAITGLILGYLAILAWIAYLILVVLVATDDSSALLTGSRSG